MALKIDLHVHTCYSYDGITTPREVVAYARRRGLDGVAVTDHDTVGGALKLLGETNFIIIPGLEITASEGHVLALDITKPIPRDLMLSETVQRIHDAGGLAVMAHPNALYKGSKSMRNTRNFDAVEVINSAAVPFSLSKHLSRKLAVDLNLPQVAGSDAHYGPEIGFAYTIIDADPEVDEIVQAIKNGATIPRGEAIPWNLRFKRVLLNLKRKLNKHR